MTTAAQALEALDKLRIAVTWAPDAGQERYREQLDAIRQHIESTAAELEAMRKDAERYRWLRANPVQCANAADDQTYGRKKDKPEEFDAAVDAALNQGGK